MAGYITKNIFLNTFTCPTLGWEVAHNFSTETLSLHGQFIIKEGIEVCKRARSLYSEGVQVSCNNESAAKTTAKLLKDHNCSVILLGGAS